MLPRFFRRPVLGAMSSGEGLVCRARGVCAVCCPAPNETVVVISKLHVTHIVPDVEILLDCRYREPAANLSDPVANAEATVSELMCLRLTRLISVGAMSCMALPCTQRSVQNNALLPLPSMV